MAVYEGIGTQEAILRQTRRTQRETDSKRPLNLNEGLMKGMSCGRLCGRMTNQVESRLCNRVPLMTQGELTPKLREDCRKWNGPVGRALRIVPGRGIGRHH